MYNDTLFKYLTLFFLSSIIGDYPHPDAQCTSTCSED